MSSSLEACHFNRRLRPVPEGSMLANFKAVLMWSWILFRLHGPIQTGVLQDSDGQLLGKTILVTIAKTASGVHSQDQCQQVTFGEDVSSLSKIAASLQTRGVAVKGAESLDQICLLKGSETRYWKCFGQAWSFAIWKPEFLLSSSLLSCQLPPDWLDSVQHCRCVHWSRHNYITAASPAQLLSSEEHHCWLHLPSLVGPLLGSLSSLEILG